MPMLPFLSVASEPSRWCVLLSPGLKVPSWYSVQLPPPDLRSSNQRMPASTVLPLRAVFWLVAKSPTIDS